MYCDTCSADGSAGLVWLTVIMKSLLILKVLNIMLLKGMTFFFFFSILGVAGGKHMLIYGGDSQLAVQSARVPSKEQWYSLQGRVMG